MKESVDALRQRLSADQAVREVITKRAYEIYEERGSQPGHEIEHWVDAENEIVARLIASQSQTLAGPASVADSQPTKRVAQRAASRDVNADRPDRRKATG